MMLNWKWRALAVMALLVVGLDFSVAQKDSVYRTGASNKLLRGRVVKSTAFDVTVEVGGRQEKVPASEIEKISFSGEPRTLGRAREHFENERFNDCLETVQKIEEASGSKLVKQEIQFFTAFSTGKIALTGDPNISPQVAEQTLANFVQANSDSYRLVVAVDLYAQLLMANGKTQQAQRQFSKLTKSQWPAYIARGHFFEGETLIHDENYTGARQSFQALKGLESSDSDTNQYKLLAECQLAKIAGLTGDPKRAIASVEQIIQNESADNNRLFAYAYNALGTCYLKSNDPKKACRAFLHTELLFSAESDAHAEALYNLAKIWPQLKDNERANRAREMLTNRYRNSIWASKL